MGKKLVAVLIPLSFKHELNDSEKISLKHLEYYLGEYDKYFIAPKNSVSPYKEIPLIQFDKKYFGSVKAHNRLLLSKDFYQTFTNYKFILIYHLDSLVFNGSIEKWCSLDYDFIGPPWIKGTDLPWLKKNGVGNGGFSLRKIDAFVKLLNSKVEYKTLNSPSQGSFKSFTISVAKYYIQKLTKYIRPDVNTIIDHAKVHVENNGSEDRFICKYAQKYYPGFKIAPVELALQFGFEANPEICYELNDHHLPFGCHAWERYNRKFWEPYLKT